jgi:signal transduction histidine kinase
LRTDDIQAVALGADGAIWLGTREGVSRISQGEVYNLPPPDPTRPWEDSRPIGSFLADSRNRLLVFAWADFFDCFAGGQWESSEWPRGLAQLGGIWAVYEDREHQVWYGSKHGVARQSGTNWTYFYHTNLSVGGVRVIYQDQRGDMWFGAFGEGLIRLHDGQWTTYATSRGSRNNRAWWIHEDVEGVFWVATEDGLNRFVPPGVEGAKRPRDQGIKGMRDQQNRFFTFTTEHGLPDNIINNIQEDEFGYFWLSGLRGIYRVAREQLNEVAAGRRGQAECIAYGEADGMLNSECNGGDNQPAGCKDKAGRIWFPTAQGVVVIDPRQIRRNEVPPPVVIEQVKANDRVIFGDGCPGESKVQSPKSKVRREEGSPAGLLAAAPARVRVPAGGARVLEVHYTANSLVAPEKVRFKYRLEGYETGWCEAGDRRVAFYTNLRPGDYTFQVMAANPHGVWSTGPDSFAFSLAPHFRETWFFYGLCACGLIGSAAVVQAYRLRWQHRLLKVEEQRALAAERARIARDLHDDLGTALTGLALELDVTGREANGAAPVATRLGEAAARTRDLAERMREVVWTINPRCDTVSSLATFLEQQVGQFLRADGIRVRLDFPEDIPSVPIGAEARHQLALSVREALTNVVRHARATEVIVSLAIADQSLLVQVQDNGRGFQPHNNDGHGLANMRARMQQVSGELECVTQPGAGTTLRFRLPLSARSASA